MLTTDIDTTIRMDNSPCFDLLTRESDSSTVGLSSEAPSMTRQYAHSNWIAADFSTWVPNRSISSRPTGRLHRFGSGFCTTWSVSGHFAAPFWITEAIPARAARSFALFMSRLDVPSTILRCAFSGVPDCSALVCELECPLVPTIPILISFAKPGA